MPTNLVRWEPFRDLMSLREAMDRLFEDSFVSPRAGRLVPFAGPGIDLDVYETKDDVVVKASIPGVKPEDIDINVVGDTVTIKGQAQEESEVEESNYIYRERRSGTFQRSFTLPISVQADKAEASFENGVLRLTLPKAEEVKPKKITVKASK